MLKLKERFLKIGAVALPIIIQGIVFQIQSLTDKAFLGNVAAKYISALGAAQFPYSTTMDSVVALSTGLIIYTAQLYGAHKQEKINAYVKSSMFYGTCISAALFMAWYFFAESILRLLCVDESILAESACYIRICSGALLFLGIDSALQGMLQGMGNTKPIMAAGIMKVILNIVISYILIFGYFGLPAMHIKGAAIGTLMANVTSSLVLIYYCLLSKKKMMDLIGSVHAYFKLGYYKAVVSVGLPTALEYFLWNASNLVLIAFLNSFSYEATAIYTLTFGIEVVIYAVFNGTAKAAMTLMGQDIGASDYKGADDCMKISVLVNLGIVLGAGILLGIFKADLLGLFTKDSALVQKTGPFLMFTALIMFPKSINVIIGNGIRAYGDTKWMLCSQIFGSIFVVVFSLILVKGMNMKITAIYLTLFADELMRAVINGIYYRWHYGDKAKYTVHSKLQNFEGV